MSVNRLTRKFYGQQHNTSNIPDVKYYYDNDLADANTAHSWGKMRYAEVTLQGQGQANANGHGYLYDARGRPLADVITTTYTTRPYTTTYAYDTADRLTSVTYPDPQQTPEQVTVGYNTQGMGLPNLLTSNLAGNPNPVDSASYNERGQLATLGQGTSGNGNYLSTAFTYDDASTKRGWLTRVQTTSNNGATTLLDLNMGYTLNGNISSVSQTAGGDPNNPTFTNSFAYDGLDRLRVVTSTLFLNETYTFDTLGRMTSRTIGGTNYTLSYSDTAHIDAPTYYSRTGSYSYDDNGNQKSGTVNGTSQTRSVDAENRVTQVVTGTILATTLTFVYDANGKRIVQTIAPQLGKTSRTLYIGNLYEEDITNGSSGSSPYISYYYLGMKLVGMRRANQISGNGQYRIVGDHLGSTSIIVDTSAPPSVVQRQYYKPYGESAFQYTAGSRLTTYGYTGQRLDEDSGLMYYGARYYDPALSLFVTDALIIDAPIACRYCGGLGKWLKSKGVAVKTVDTPYDLLNHDPIDDIPDESNPTYPCGADGCPPYGDKTTEYPQDPGWWWWLGGWPSAEEKGHEWNVRLNWHYWTATHLANQSRAFLQAHWR